MFSFLRTDPVRSPLARLQISFLLLSAALIFLGFLAVAELGRLARREAGLERTAARVTTQLWALERLEADLTLLCEEDAPARPELPRWMSQDALQLVESAVALALELEDDPVVSFRGLGARLGELWSDSQSVVALQGSGDSRAAASKILGTAARDRETLRQLGRDLADRIAGLQERRWLEVWGALLLIAILGLTAHLTIVRPGIRDLERTVQQGLQAQERLKLAVQGSSDGLWDFDPRTNEVWYSERFCRMLGELELPPVLSSFELRLHPDDHARTMERVARHLEHREPYDVEYRLRTASGEYLWFRARGQAVWNEAGEPIRMAGSIQDIHNKKRNAMLLQESELRLQMLIDSTCDAIVATRSSDDAIVEFNPAAERLFGVSREEALGRRCSEFLQLSGRAADREGKATCDGTVRAADGDSYAVEVTTGEFDDESDTLLVHVIRDTTEKRSLELRLQESQKMEAIGQLAAGIAHEINTPTQYVSDNARFLNESFHELRRLLVEMGSWLEDEDASLDGVRRAYAELSEELDVPFLTSEIPAALEHSKEGLERISRIVRSMKEFSHPGQAEKTAVDLNRALESTLVVSRSEWKNIAEVETDFDEKLPPVSCLPGEINQVFLNLIVNAAHAIAEAREATGRTELGRLRVGTRAVGDAVEIHVQDDGIGMSEEVRVRVFEPFFTTKPQGLGTGQGLAITHNVVVQDHGGAIEVDSVPGEGTTVVLRLPL